MKKMELYSAIKKNEIRSFVGKWMDLDIIMVSEISQTQKDKYQMFFSHMWNLHFKKDTKIEGRLFEKSKRTSMKGG
jgi:hypothetical protein